MLPVHRKNSSEPERSLVDPAYAHKSSSAQPEQIVGNYIGLDTYREVGVATLIDVAGEVEAIGRKGTQFDFRLARVPQIRDKARSGW